MLTAARLSAKPVETASQPAGWVEIHPRYRAWLRKCGLASASDVLALRGEVVCGHADRHVVKVELRAGETRRAAYLKREHVVGRRARFRNWRDGFGWVSRAEREADTLGKLEAGGLPGPQWLAYGEDATGRAFLLVEELTAAVPLCEYLSGGTASADDIRSLAEGLGRTLAECHAAGIGTPELAAKHIFIRPGVMRPVLVDWQSTRRSRGIFAVEAAGWFGTLHATLPEGGVSLRDRLRVVWAYRRALKARGQRMELSFATFLRGVADAGRKRSKRSSVRHQLGAGTAAPQRLVWLDGEALVAIPEVAARWTPESARPPFYERLPGSERVTLPCGAVGEVTRFRSSAPLGRLAALFRERPWRSPGAVAARNLFHLERFGIAAPKLLAFGQRRMSPLQVRSFVVAQHPTSPPEAGLRGTALARSLAADNPLRNHALGDIGRYLKGLHAAGCRLRRRLLGTDALLVMAPDLTVASVFAVRVVRRVSSRQARSDLAFALAGLDRFDKMRVLRMYLGSSAAEKWTWDRFARAVL